MAKDNVERKYSVVGVLEEMDVTSAVSEKHFLLFFNNARLIDV